MTSTVFIYGSLTGEVQDHPDGSFSWLEKRAERRLVANSDAATSS
jgi:hypothetical protein